MTNLVPIAWFATGYVVGYKTFNVLWQRQLEKEKKANQDINNFIMENPELKQKFGEMRTRSW